MITDKDMAAVSRYVRTYKSLCDDGHSAADAMQMCDVAFDGWNTIRPIVHQLHGNGSEGYSFCATVAWMAQTGRC